MHAGMRTATVLALAAIVAAGGGCSGHEVPPTKPPPNYRTYIMGFSSFPPKLSIASILQTIDTFAPRADAALIVTEPPWDSLLAGRSPDSLIMNNQLGLANYMRARGLRIVVSVDPTNGLNRAQESAALVAAGRSLSEPAVPALYRDYLPAMGTIIHPDYLGIASETNPVRATAPASGYNAGVAAAGAAGAGAGVGGATGDC